MSSSLFHSFPSLRFVVEAAYLYSLIQVGSLMLLSLLQAHPFLSKFPYLIFLYLLEFLSLVFLSLLEFLSLVLLSLLEFLSIVLLSLYLWQLCHYSSKLLIRTNSRRLRTSRECTCLCCSLCSWLHMRGLSLLVFHRQRNPCSCNEYRILYQRRLPK